MNMTAGGKKHIIKTVALWKKSQRKYARHAAMRDLGNKGEKMNGCESAA